MLIYCAASLQARLDGESQLQRLIEMLLSRAWMIRWRKKLSQNQPSAECHSATDSEESGCSAVRRLLQHNGTLVGSWLIHLLERHAMPFGSITSTAFRCSRLDDIDLRAQGTRMS